MRRWLDRLATGLIVSIVALYRATLRAWMGTACRYHPTCSQYMLDAVAKHGPWRGGWRGIRRIARCHPWGGSGYDPA
jgi:putative membrane protein insertion efficiency factor